MCKIHAIDSNVEIGATIGSQLKQLISFLIAVKNSESQKLYNEVAQPC